jgi:hypothetical protein
MAERASADPIEREGALLEGEDVRAIGGAGSANGDAALAGGGGRRRLGCPSRRHLFFRKPSTAGL